VQSLESSTPTTNAENSSSYNHIKKGSRKRVTRNLAAYSDKKLHGKENQVPKEEVLRTKER
jgi:hypothetical protein